MHEKTLRRGEMPTSPSAMTNTPPTTDVGGGTTGTTACAVSPSETVGPYPSHGDYFRSNVTDGQPGLPLALTITVVNAASGCTPVAGANVEIWQCDHEGVYSEYGQGQGQTYLRGIQATDAEGRVTFQTVYPGWYQGRATHIHVEVTMNGRSVKVTQIAFPEDVTAAVYRTGVYASKGQNATTNGRDNVFADSVSLEMVTLSGNTTSGFTGTFQVGVAV
jgi:protocatechuate 3,4-dioxygenase beta subunit